MAVSSITVRVLNLSGLIMEPIITAANKFRRPDGSTAYHVYSHTRGYLGIVGNHHAERRSPGAITQHTWWWAQFKESPNAEVTSEADKLPSRATAIYWLKARLPKSAAEPSADERFTMHIEATAADLGHDAAWRVAAQASYLRLHELLAARYNESSPRALWREVIMMISWFDASLPSKKSEDKTES